MTHLTDQLTHLNIAASVARDYGYINTARVLDRLALEEKRRLRAEIRTPSGRCRTDRVYGAGSTR